jgi:hypothetical protein
VAIVSGDFIHSGHLGLAVVDGPNAATYILLGKGDGTFAPSSAAFASSPSFDVALATADLNGDGNLDLAFEDDVVLGYGDGAFSSAGSLYNSGLPESVALGDFNGDGRLDAVVANGSTKTSPGSELTVSLGKGDGTFTSAVGSPIPLGNDLSAAVAADFNGDGKLDLAVADAGSNAVMILLGNGDGTFGAQATFAVGNSPRALLAADSNAFGHLFTHSFVAESACVFEETCGDSSEEEPANMSHVSHSSCLYCCYRASIEELCEKPQTDQERRGNKSDAHKYKNEQKCANPIMRVGNQKRAHNGGNRTARA